MCHRVVYISFPMCGNPRAFFERSLGPYFRPYSATSRPLIQKVRFNTYVRRRHVRR